MAHLPWPEVWFLWLGKFPLNSKAAAFANSDFIGNEGRAAIAFFPVKSGVLPRNA